MMLDSRGPIDHWKKDCIAMNFGCMRTVFVPGALAVTVLLGTSRPAFGQHERVLSELNDHATVRGSDEIKSYQILFDAYLELSEPPFEVGPQFNLATIHAGMAAWPEVSGWAEGNPEMAEAIDKCRDRNIIGLPYGENEVASKYRDAGLFAAVGVDDSLRNNEFGYILAIDTIAAFATAEAYRLLEAGQAQEAMDLSVSLIFLLRQGCDRRFFDEKTHFIGALSSALSNLRDMFYLYRDTLTIDQYTEIARYDLPFLKPDRQHLLIPEGDRIIASAMLDEVFEGRQHAVAERFATMYAGIQSQNAPLERFGAAVRWRMIAGVHGSLEASQERLQLIYDDWWRRWRIQEHDPILEIETQFDRTNPVRYAAVIFSMQDIESVFKLRTQLIAEVAGTSLAAGLAAHYKSRGEYPDDHEQLYGEFARKISDVDPYDPEFGPLRYILLRGPTAVDTPAGRLRLQKGDCLLYARGQDSSPNRGTVHTPDGAGGDTVFWPPIVALERETGLID